MRIVRYNVLLIGKEFWMCSIAECQCFNKSSVLQGKRLPTDSRNCRWLEKKIYKVLTLYAVYNRRLACFFLLIVKRKCFFVFRFEYLTSLLSLSLSFWLCLSDCLSLYLFLLVHHRLNNRGMVVEVSY